MNKNEYMAKLNHALEGLPVKVRQDMLNDYQEHFRSGMEMGRTEEDIADSLGDPLLIAGEIRGHQRYPQSPQSPSPFSIFRALWMSFWLFLFNLIFVLGPYLAVLGILLGFWAAAFGLGLGGVAAIGTMIFAFVSYSHRFLLDTGLSFMTIVAGSVFISSIGALWGIGCWYMSKAFIKLTVKYANWNFRTIIGRRY